MLTAVIIDDEPNALEVLQLQLENFCKDVQVLAVCAGGKKGIEAIIQYKPALVFLDIEMPHVNGFDVLKATSQYNYEVIFTTAYDQFAIKAFKFSALDYLLKPVDIMELQTAVQKATSKTAGSKLDEKLNKLLQQFQPGIQQQRIALQAGDALQLFETDDILHCESESNYTHIHLATGKKITLAKTLKEVEENLGGAPFYRIHQSHLININHISKVIKGEGAYVIMKNGSNIAISRTRKDNFLEMLRKI